MKTIIIILTLLMLSLPLNGQLSHPWWVTDGGGGKSSGGTLSLTASVGQPGIQKMTYIDTGMVLEGGYIPGLRTFSGTWTTAHITPAVSWNLLSVPLLVPDMRKIALYPSAISVAFVYEPGGYIQADTLENGRSYWVKFPTPAPSPYAISGTVTTVETVSVFLGWNMIGSLSYPILASSVIPIAPVAISSRYFGYTGGLGYYEEDTLKPGVGYWVKSSRAGSIVLQYSTLLAQQNPIVAAVNRKGAVELFPGSTQSMEAITSVVIQDNKGLKRGLMFTGASESVDLDKYELPPLPPEGLDVRYATGRYAEMPKAESGTRQEFPIRITGAEFPIVLNWDAGTSEKAPLTLEISYAGEKIKQYSLATRGSVTIREENFIGAKLIFTGSPVKELPKEFALYQNYPNPFNPSTKIRYDLPKNAKVTMKVYNLIGQEVKVLVDGLQEAGFKTIEFDANDLPSGIYFYRLQSDDFSMVRKLMLVR